MFTVSDNFLRAYVDRLSSPDPAVAAAARTEIESILDSHCMTPAQLELTRKRLDETRPSPPIPMIGL